MVKLEYAVMLTFKATNSVVEYEALILALRLVKALGATRIKVSSNTQLGVNQMRGVYKVKDENIG